MLFIFPVPRRSAKSRKGNDQRHYACVPLIAVGDWPTAYVIGGSVLALAFLLHFAYFVRLDGPGPAMQ